ncbi:hypothetical protein COOONC_24227, partial [Cooperia oncophora]
STFYRQAIALSIERQSAIGYSCYNASVEKGGWPICFLQNRTQLVQGVHRVADGEFDTEHNGDVMLHKLTYARNQSSYENEMYVMRGGTRAVCRGDSGAGLYRVDEGDSRATVLGVLSGGTSCYLVEEHRSETFTTDQMFS